jgi:hypothetical protein
MFLPLEGSFSEKILKIFSRGYHFPFFYSSSKFLGSYPTFEELARQNNWQIPVSKPQQFTLNGQTYVFSPASSPSFIPQQPQTSVVSNLSPQQQAILSAYAAQNPSQLYNMNGQTFAAPQTYSTDSVRFLKFFQKKYSRNFFGYHGTFIESGNVYIETKRNVDPYIAFLMHPCVVVWRENQD